MATPLETNTTKLTDLKSKLGVSPDENPFTKLQEKTVAPSAAPQKVTPDDNYIALSKVTVNGDANLVPENIKEGVSIFGVEGNHKGESVNSIDYSSNVYSTTSIFYYNKSGTYVTKEIGNISGTTLDDIDFAKETTFDLGSQGQRLGIKLVNGILEVGVYDGGGATP